MPFVRLGRNPSRINSIYLALTGLLWFPTLLWSNTKESLKEVATGLIGLAIGVVATFLVVVLCLIFAPFGQVVRADEPNKNGDKAPDMV